MHCHLMVYVRIVMTTLVTITCLLGDNFVELTQHPMLKALADNATHAAIGALTGIAFVVQFYERTTDLFGWVLIFICFAISSLIDVDHFVAARSWNLEDATNLSRRPFLHCSTIMLPLLILYICTACLNYLRMSQVFGVLLCAFLTHHARDAVRRGFWLCPLGNTERLPQVGYIMLTIAAPYMFFYLHGLCRSAPVQYFMGQYIKLHDNSRVGSGGYRYMTV